MNNQILNEELYKSLIHNKSIFENIFIANNKTFMKECGSYLFNGQVYEYDFDINKKVFKRDTSISLEYNDSIVSLYYNNPFDKEGVLIDTFVKVSYKYDYKIINDTPYLFLINNNDMFIVLTSDKIIKGLKETNNYKPVDLELYGIKIGDTLDLNKFEANQKDSMPNGMKKVYLIKDKNVSVVYSKNMIITELNYSNLREQNRDEFIKYVSTKFKKPFTETQLDLNNKGDKNIYITFSDFATELQLNTYVNNKYNTSSKFFKDYGFWIVIYSDKYISFIESKRKNIKT